MAVESVVIALDGESKSGKTTIINMMAEEAQFQHDIIPNLLEGTYGEFPISERSAEALLALQEGFRFNSIARISAGNTFRAATLFVALLGLKGITVDAFNDAHAVDVREVLAIEGVEKILQTDPNIAEQVNPTAKLAGAQALCGSIFCDFVDAAYHKEGGSNLVIVDARDPIGHMKRNKLIGDGPGQIKPTNIIPLYVDTPTDVAAMRMSGDYHENLAHVMTRRHIDATREELPIVRPDEMIEDFGEWHKGLFVPRSADDLDIPWRFDNDEHVDLLNAQRVASEIAAIATEMAHYNGRVA